MFCDVDHPEVPLSDWQTFVKAFPPHLIADVIDRRKIGLPNWFVPFAHGVAIASNALLREAGHRLGMHRPRGWLNYNVDMFRWMIDWDPFNGRWLLVRQCNNQGLWTVERWHQKRPHGNADEVLVHQFGSTPIFTQSYQAAMRLGMHCHANGPPAGLRWISACPENIQELIDDRRIDEIIARRNAHQEDYLREGV
jgi:hypothetical protein